MAALGFTLFETAIGRCGIAWGERGIVGVQLPEGRALATRTRVIERFPDARETDPPLAIRRARDAIVALLRGEAKDLSTVTLDMQHVPAFHQQVYAVARSIPHGETLSYGEIAARLGTPGAARAVGQAMRRNPFAIVVPCHRVLAAGGKVGGFTADGGAATKLRMLAIEGVAASPAPLVAPVAAPQAPAFEIDDALRHLTAADAALGRLIERIGPFRMELQTSSSLFAALAEAIVYQQLTGKAAGTIFERLCALCPKSKLSAAQVLALSDEALRGAGLSQAKLLSLKDLARRVDSKALPSLKELEKLDDQSIIDRLTQVRGVGRWTVEMLLIFRLGRRDVLPLDDYGVKKGFAAAFSRPELPSRIDLERRGERWRPYRSVASWYLWRASELTKKSAREPDSGARLK
jgi:methylated-DNA-[protein]-cysteine S-methyltransferase